MPSRREQVLAALFVQIQQVQSATNKWLAALPGLVVRNWREPGG